MKLYKLALLPLVASLPLMAATPAPHWTPETVVLMTDYCHGDEAATTTIHNYCRKNGCNDNDKAVAARFCAELEAEELADNTPPPPPEPEPEPEPPTQDNNVPAPQPSPDWTPETVALITDFCHGDPAAIKTLQNYCRANGCSDSEAAVVDRYCTDLEAWEIAANSPTPTPLPIEEPTEETPPVNAGEHSLIVNWDIPTQRIDGRQMSASELAGYEIFITSESSGESRRIEVDNPYATEHVIDMLQPDLYHVALVSIDSEGTYSELSEIVSTTISDS